MRQEDPVEVDVIVGSTEWLGEAPSWLWIGEFRLTRDDARSIRDDLDSLLSEHSPVDGPLPYRVWEHGGRTSWGGDSGEYLQVGIFLAKAFTEGMLAVATFKLYERLSEKHRRNGNDAESWHEPLTRASAIEQARWIITGKYREITIDSLTEVPDDSDSLILISDSHDVEKDLWTIALRDKQGAVYRVTLGRKAGISTPTLVERDAPPEIP